ncbi:MAG: PAS domain-containing protein, partial [Pirellulaceae bacterium]
MNQPIEHLPSVESREAPVAGNVEPNSRGAIAVEIESSDLRRAEAALHESEQRLRNITENAPDIILQAARDGTITYCNRVYPPYTLEQTIGSKCEDWVPPDCRAQVRDAIERVFVHGERSHYETAGVGRNGELVWYSSRISPVIIEGQVASAIRNRSHPEGLSGGNWSSRG